MANIEGSHRIIELPPLTPEAVATFDDLELDTYTGGEQRYRRFSQFRLDWDGDRWRTALLPYRPFVQSKAVNSLVGGVQRPFPPLAIDPSTQLEAVADDVALDRAHPWQVNLHQCRVITNDAISGVSVPEGPHRDGHEFGLLAVWSRQNISGGESQLLPSGGGEPFFRHVLQPGEALAYDDRTQWHNATDISAPNGEQGHRDLWIVALNRWDRRRYGEEFEREAGVGA